MSTKKSNKTNKTNEPIAIVGIGCRFPGGANTPDRFWNLLAEGVDALIDVPKDRWDFRRFYDDNTDRPGKTHAKQAGFLKENIFEFDPLFFGMSPREAASLDPQQRILLESTYEAMEDAGLDINALRGSNTGVFIGGFCLDSKLIQLGELNREIVSSHTSTSSTMVMISNRLSYAFDLKGPSVTMDTACSSSLVAAHFACQSIWSGESDMVITGGVNTMMSPQYPIAMTKGHFLSKHSRCKAFDEDAGGYTRGEGAGIVVLKPLSKAQADGDIIYAVVRSSGANQDGQTNGITVPNKDSQSALIKKVYAKANVKAADVQYIEAHGTGTQAGDPVEVGALNAALNEGRKKNEKCFVGSVKTNIGHLEAGAGVAGLIKATLSVNKAQVAPNLHFKKANPKINFDELCLKVPTKLEKWPATKDKRRASINSFGYGGTNGHVLLEEAPSNKTTKSKTKNNRALYLVPVSARGEAALQELCGKYYDFLNENKKVSLDDFIYSLSKRRTHHRNRLSIVCKSRKDLMEKLKSYSEGSILQGMNLEQANLDEQPKLAFVYTGMGPQWWGMGRELLETEPVFRKAVEECDKIFKKISGWSILKEITKTEKQSKISQTAIAQPANFVIQAGLTALWKSWGITPDAVVGHSVGEVASAYQSGALSLEDGLLVSYHRSRAQQTTAGQGTMLAIGLGEEDAHALVQAYDTISVAAVNASNAVTLAGEEAALKEVSSLLEEQGVFNRMLTVEVAYHSYQMDPLEAELKKVLKKVKAKKAKMPLYSTVTGAKVKGSEFGCDYWWQNVRQQVSFAKAIKSMIADGYTMFLEVGPQPVTRTSINDCFKVTDTEGHTVSSIRMKEPELNNMMNSLGTLHGLGFNANWDEIAPQGEYVKLPLYPWQRDVYWNETYRSKQDRFGVEGHVFLNNDLQQPNPSWELEINDKFLPWLDDHQVENMIVVPGASYVEAGLALHQKEYGEAVCTLQNLDFNQVLVVDKSRIQMLHTTVHQQSKTYSVYSRYKEDEVGWQLHAQGRMLEQTIDRTAPTVKLTELKKACKQTIDAGEFYQSLTDRGLHYGPYFQGVKEIYKGNSQVLVKLEGSKSLKANKDKYLLHPTILDSGFQSMVAIVDDNSSNPNPFVPVSIDRVTLYKSPGNKCWSHGVITSWGENTIKGDLTLFDDKGNVLVEVKGLTCQAISQSSGEEEEKQLSDWLYNFHWSESEVVEESTQERTWLAFGNTDDPDYANLIGNASCTVVTKAKSYKKINANHYQIDPNNSKDYDKLVKATGSSISDVLFLWSIEDVNRTNIEIPQMLDHTMPLVYMANSFSKHAADTKINLSIVTRGAQVVKPKDKVTDLVSAPLWGLNHLVGNEYPNIMPKMIDLDPKNPQNELKMLSAELIGERIDEDVAFRAGSRYIKSLEKTIDESADEAPTTQTVSTDIPVQLEIGYAGRMDSLHYSQFKARNPKDDEIQVRVHAASINFKDLLKVLGQISSKVLDGTYFGNTFGMECSGIITKVGKKVKDHKVGDKIVVATPEGCFSSYVTVKPTYNVKLPSKLKFEEAPVMIPYMTVIHGLVHKADIQPGEKILIHNAAGAVGLAAIQVAKWKGAEIFATAGTPEKREYLKSLGIKHVLDSRTLQYVKDIKEITKGYGIDVVLNAIAGESLYQSFALLAPYGRFIEIGKRDIAENTGLPMHVFNRNISFSHIDIDRILAERTPVAQGLLKEIYDGFEAGHFYAMPVKPFLASEAEDAFSYVRRSEHMGKVVITFNEQEVEVPIKPKKTEAYKKKGTYLITGGTGGFGLQIAKRLSSKGVQNLILLSRSGLKSDESKAAVKQMEANGTKVLADPCDITDSKSVAKVLAKAKRTMPKLNGIFHGAMVLDDGFLADMNRGRFNTSFQPKVAGAMNLHNNTLDTKLDFFISFSSISSVIGNGGQANYVAANAFLDGFAHFRRAQGLAATTINLGVLREVGVVARDSSVEMLLEGAGISGFTNAEALDSIEEIIKMNPVQIGLFDLNWGRWSNGNPKGAASSRFRDLVATSGADAGGANETQTAIAMELAVLQNGERNKFMEAKLVTELATILKLPEDKIDTDRGINFLGIDSLMAVELERGISTNIGIEVSTMELLSGPTLKQLAATLIEKIEIPDAADLPDVDEMSEEDLDKLLAEVELQEVTK